MNEIERYIFFYDGGHIMKKQFLGLALMGLIASTVPAHAMQQQNNNGYAQRVQDYFFGMMFEHAAQRATNALPPFLRGETHLETAARTMLFASAIYLAVKPIFAQDGGNRRLTLGLLSLAMGIFGINNFRVNNVNVAERANNERDGLFNDVRNNVRAGLVNTFNAAFNPQPDAQQQPQPQNNQNQQQEPGIFQRWCNYYFPQQA